MNWGRLRRWEFMPYWLFYGPIYLFVLILGVRHRALTFFTAANPAFRLGGFVDYSKFRVQQLLPSSLLPRTILVLPGTSLQEIRDRMQRLAMEYPVILKPDRGERGLAVEEIATEHELASLLSEQAAPMLVQEYLGETKEFGVLYMRRPGRRRGVVTSVVIKEPLVVTGDGVQSLDQLIEADERCRLNRELLRSKLDGQLQQIPAHGEARVLAGIGNHVRGATFRDGNHLIDDRLSRTFDRIGTRIEGFFVGRFDVKANSEEDLVAGRFRIIELNGVNSEPAHIYHPGRSILLAYHDLVIHWYRIARISADNHRRGSRYATLLEVAQAIRRHSRMAGRLRDRPGKKG